MVTRLYADLRRSIKHQLYKHIYQKQSTVMLHFGRTGSSVLCNQFVEHLDIDWATEVYDPQHVNNNPDWKNIDNPIHIVQNMMNRDKSSLFGFEVKVFRGQHLDIMFNSSSIKDFVASVSKIGISSFVILKRKNYLRQYLSAHLAEQRNKWHFSKDEKASAQSIILPIAPASMNTYNAPIVEYFRQMDRTYLEIENSLIGRKQLWLTYEDDIEGDPKLGHNKCCAFWSVKPRESSISLSRAASFPLTSLISNFSEVERALIGSEYEWMLYD
jgi:hypothetical protein